MDGGTTKGALRQNGHGAGGYEMDYLWIDDEEIMSTMIDDKEIETHRHP